MKITKLTQNNYKDFDFGKFQNSFWQSGIWINIILSGGQAESVFVLELDSKYAVAEKRKITFGFGLFVLGVSDENIALFREDLIKLSKEDNCLFVQFETINYEGYKTQENFQKGSIGAEKDINSSEPYNSYGEGISRFGSSKTSFSKVSYYKKFITPYTALIDLTKTEEEILAQMKPKGRYNIKVAEKNEIVVKNAEITDENISVFYDLMMETTSRDSFNGNSLEFYKRFLNASDNNLLFIAYKGEVPVAAGIFVYFGELATYYYGASSSDKAYRNLMSPYLLQWNAIKEGKFRGCKLYDFLGIASPNEENSPLAGVTDFKLKLTPDSREVSHCEIYINNKIKYNLILLLKKLKK
ncbi:MAG: peptidoglycan bridge formation glycyltransferase FemA/FemB family protein [Candidatus Gracilibacteria bacterium]|nr:peptidoglycan bridge formation glycyltransferase FemA/FemB family protein [Candidatus Gracilibacteria bacterium]